MQGVCSGQKGIGMTIEVTMFIDDETLEEVKVNSYEDYEHVTLIFTQNPTAPRLIFSGKDAFGKFVERLVEQRCAMGI